MDPFTFGELVSILSRPAGRELREQGVFHFRNLLVSILSRPAGRELHPIRVAVSYGTDEFQSSPDPQAGSYAAIGAQLGLEVRVSILSRPAGRELREGAK